MPDVIFMALQTANIAIVIISCFLPQNAIFSKMFTKEQEIMGLWV